MQQLDADGAATKRHKSAQVADVWNGTEASMMVDTNITISDTGAGGDGGDIRTDQTSLPKSFDWRQRGKVTAVKDQRTCNACYAFAVASSIESALAIKYNVDVDEDSLTRNQSEKIPLDKDANMGNIHYLDVDLSVQQLIDCTNGNGYYKNNACRYGFIEDTFQYVMRNGLVPSSLYPYTFNVSWHLF